MEKTIMDFKPSLKELQNDLGPGTAEAFLNGEYKPSTERENMAIAVLLWYRGERAQSFAYLKKLSPGARRGFLLAHGGF